MMVPLFTLALLTACNGSDDANADAPLDQVSDAGINVDADRAIDMGGDAEIPLDSMTETDVAAPEALTCNGDFQVYTPEDLAPLLGCVPD